MRKLNAGKRKEKGKKQGGTVEEREDREAGDGGTVGLAYRTEQDAD